MNCSTCGAALQPNISKCLKCGTVASQATPQPMPQAGAPAAGPTVIIQQQQMPMMPPKSKVTAALLAFFLGGLGVHNFYLGYAGRGIAQLLIMVFTGWLIIPAFIVGIWAFIEFILILTGSLKDAQGRPLV